MFYNREFRLAVPQEQWFKESPIKPVGDFHSG
jgi:hypothetical protein